MWLGDVRCGAETAENPEYRLSDPLRTSWQAADSLQDLRRGVAAPRGTVHLPPMSRLKFFFDYIDPASRVMELRLRAVLGEGFSDLDLVPREVRTPHQPPLDPTGESWTRYWAAMEELAPDEMRALTPPERLPHTRKAHELMLHTPQGDSRSALHSAIFTAALEEGRDIGRVDVLVDLAVAAGLDRSETRAVLDVDRYTEEVEQIREASSTTGVVGVPTLMRDDVLLEGVHDSEAIRAFVMHGTHDD